MLEQVKAINIQKPVQRTVGRNLNHPMPLDSNLTNPTLNWIDSQRDPMLARVKSLCEINSFSANTNGVNRYLDAIEPELRALTDDIERIKLNPVKSIDDNGREVTTVVGDALLARSRRDAPFRVLLNIHSDTVYPESDLFPLKLIDQNTLNGPGVIDARGGLVVMLTALSALEQSKLAPFIGWDVLINPDEEIGSPASTHLLQEAASRNHAGMVYEPALPDGALVSSRKGSGTFTIVVRGRSAHAGRDFEKGRNAIVSAAKIVQQLHQMNGMFDGVTLNIGRFAGGGASNVVPDLAMFKVNCRAVKPEQVDQVKQVIKAMCDLEAESDGITVEMHGDFSSRPRIEDEVTQTFLEVAFDAGRKIGLNLTARPTGGACDGNKLRAAGLPVIDSLGPRGDHMHSHREFLHIDSLTERARLSALMLLRFAHESQALV